METKILQSEIAFIKRSVNPLNAAFYMESMSKYTKECAGIPNADEKQQTAELAADAYYKLAEIYMNEANPFSSLNCVLGCRELYDMVPQSEHIAFMLLQAITGLSYVKNQLHEDGMVEEYMDEALELAERFPKNADIQRQTAMCIANLVALCGGFDAPLGLAYDAVERMGAVAERFPGDEDLQNMYAHILISACYFANGTKNQTRLAQFRGQLRQLQAERANVLDANAIRGHLSQIGLA